MTHSVLAVFADAPDGPSSLPPFPLSAYKSLHRCRTPTPLPSHCPKNHEPLLKEFSEINRNVNYKSYRNFLLLIVTHS